MFEYLKPYRIILVSGPQRSGTAIGATMIAHDTGHQLMREDTHLGRYWIWHGLIRGAKNAVIQCPSCAHLVHQYGDWPDVAIVFMRRDIDAIIRSQEHIQWTWEAEELRKYDLPPHGGPIARVKYDFWDNIQRPMCLNTFDVNYADLASHPLWVSKEERHNGQWDAWETKLQEQEAT